MRIARPEIIVGAVATGEENRERAPVGPEKYTPGLTALTGKNRKIIKREQADSQKNKTNFRLLARFRKLA
jgi:hypothetical protein